MFTRSQTNIPKTNFILSTVTLHRVIDIGDSFTHSYYYAYDFGLFGQIDSDHSFLTSLVYPKSHQIRHNFFGQLGFQLFQFSKLLPN